MKYLDTLRTHISNMCTSIYDEESMTALELAGNTAAKVNECVKLTNMLIDHIDQVITERIGELIGGGQFYIKDGKLIIVGDSDDE